MAQRVVPEPSLTPVANPVDRLEAPRINPMPQTNGLLEIAKSLEQINPALQSAIGNFYNDYAQAEEAKGVMAESQMDTSVQLDENRRDWQSLIEQQRKIDAKTGGNTAELMAASSPHFRRGLMKARVQRVGLGLNEYLKQAYEKATDIHGTDDYGAVQQWVMDQTNAYAASMGISTLDPVLLAEVFAPLATRAQQTIMSGHTVARAAGVARDYANELSLNAGMILSGAIPDLDGSGAAVPSEPGVSYDDLSDPSPPTEVFSSMGGAGDDMLLGGEGDDVLDGGELITGGGGEDYTPPAQEQAPDPRIVMAKGLQNLMDNAIRDGMKPTQVNKTIVDAVISEAKGTLNTEVLDILDSINAGSGPLGNIGWVKEERQKAFDYITDEIWEEEDRSRKREEIQREDAARLIRTEAYRDLLADPTADVSGYVNLALESGNAELARGISDMQRAMLKEQEQEYTDMMSRDAMVDLRYRLAQTSVPSEIDKIFDEAARMAAAGIITKEDFGSFYDDRETKIQRSSYDSNPVVRDQRSFITDIIRERFGGSSSLMDWGDSSPTKEIELRALDMFNAKLDAAMVKDPNMSVSDYKILAVETRNWVLGLPDFQRKDDDGWAEAPAPQAAPAEEAAAQPQPASVTIPEWMRGQLVSDPSKIEETAASYGMSVAEFIAATKLFD